MPHDTGWREVNHGQTIAVLRQTVPCISNQQMKINESPGKIGTRVCSKQMDPLVALNDCSI